MSSDIQNQMTSDICKFSLERLTMQISINVKPELIEHIDAVKGTQSRSAFIVGCVQEHFSGGDADKRQLIEQLEAHNATQQRLENEVEYLRGEYSKINDALAQRLLTEGTHRAGFWARMFGRSKKE
jgi:hypothetical protein